MVGTWGRGTLGVLMTGAVLTGVAAAWAGPQPLGLGRPVPAPSLWHPVAVFGKDERVALPGDLASLEGRIGILVDDASRTVCTASCIGPDLILTAAHCIFHEGARSAPKLASFWFSPSGQTITRLARIKGESDKLALQNVMAGTTRPRLRPPIDASSDWAAIRLAAPVCAKGSLAIKPLAMAAIEAAAKDGAILQVAYHKDFKEWQLALSRNCEIHRRHDGLTPVLIRKEFSDPTQLLLHRCDTGEGSSGSPLLIVGDNGPEIVGLNVGVYLQSRILVRGGRVEKTFKAKTVANTGVSAEHLAVLVEAFRTAKPVTAAEDMQRLQERLQALGFYRGTIDGLLGEKMRAAIKAYQRSLGEPETGVPSRDLIDRLAGPAPADQPAAAGTSGG